MHDSFWVGTSLGDLLFAGLSVNNAGSMVGACCFFFFFTLLSESLKVIESRLRRDHSTRMRKSMEGVCAAGDRNTLLIDNSSVPGPSDRELRIPPNPAVQNKVLLKCCHVFLFTINTTFKYLIMLVIMLFNVYLFIAIIIGVTLGYFVFSRIRLFYNMEIIAEKRQVVTVCEPGCEDPDESTPPLLRSSGASQSGNAYSCEARAQMQKLLDRSPNSSSDGQSTQDTGVTVLREQAEVHNVILSKALDGFDVTTSDDGAKSPCCSKNAKNEEESLMTCCGADGGKQKEPVDKDFKPCSEKSKETSRKTGEPL